MKKILLLLICFGLSQNSKALTIEQISVSNIENSNDLNIHVKASNGHYFEYSNHSFNIENNTITLSICYFPVSVSVITTKENDFILSGVNFNQTHYTLVVNVNFLIWNGSEYSCNNQILSDTATLNFETPLQSIVNLGSDNFNTHKTRFEVYPNPTLGFAQYSPDLLPYVKSVKIYDTVGRLIHNQFNPNQNILDFSNCTDGIYFIEFTTNQQKITQQIILKK